jgi:hypothetical protein
MSMALDDSTTSRTALASDWLMQWAYSRHPKLDCMVFGVLYFLWIV